MASLWQLFSVFARMGAVTFGGGYAMLPILQAEVVNKYHWATDEELADYYAVGQCTPCLLYTSPSPRDLSTSRMPSSA